jgi:hypothetical protein
MYKSTRRKTSALRMQIPLHPFQRSPGQTIIRGLVSEASMATGSCSLKKRALTRQRSTIHKAISPITARVSIQSRPIRL